MINIYIIFHFEFVFDQSSNVFSVSSKIILCIDIKYVGFEYPLHTNNFIT